MPTVTVASPQGKWLLAGRPGIDFRQGQRFFFFSSHITFKGISFAGSCHYVRFHWILTEQDSGYFFTSFMKQNSFEKLVVVQRMKTLPCFMKQIEPIFFALLLVGILILSFMPVTGMCYIRFRFYVRFRFSDFCFHFSCPVS